ncbi:MAG TPA: YitT family protein [Chitinophagaceae bacterium]|nr:YitT family protein [Chitinophagaceae bacterium]
MIPQIDSILKGSKKGNGETKGSSAYRTAKQFYSFRVSLFHNISDSFMILAGVLSAGFGLKGFLLPNNFVDGGATGISLLLSETTGVSLSVLLILVNIPFAILGYSQIGRSFVIKTTFAIVSLALVVAFLPYPVITSDKLLISVFGGFFLGMGIGLAVRGGGVLDGTEILAIYISRRTSLTIGDVILILNIIIFSFAAYLLGIEIALYAILTYLSASKTVDFIIEGIEEFTGVTIISPKSEEISNMIIKKMGRGVTLYKGSGGYGKGGLKKFDQDIVYTVITRLEISRLQTELDAIDRNAFMVMHSIRDTKGGMIKKRVMS